MDDPLVRLTERMDKSKKHHDVQSMLPPASSTNRLPQSFEPRKLSTPRRSIPVNVSASPSLRFRNSSNIKTPMRSATRVDHRTPSWGHADVPRGVTNENQKKNDTINDFQEIQNLIDEGNERPAERKRPLFGRRDRKAKRVAGEATAEKPKDVDPNQNRRVLVRSPQNHRGVSKFEKEWPQNGEVFEEAENDIVTESGSPAFHHREEQPLDIWRDGDDGFNQSSTIIDTGYCSDEIRSVESYEPVGARERAIREPSSPPEERKKKSDKNGDMTDLDASLKLIPNKGEYRPGAYSSLNHDEWLLAGQNLIDRFKENSEKVQKIMTARDERMKTYTATMTEYHQFLKQRQTKLKEEREGIQESIRESISGYWKSHRM